MNMSITGERVQRGYWMLVAGPATLTGLALTVTLVPGGEVPRSLGAAAAMGSIMAAASVWSWRRPTHWKFMLIIAFELAGLNNYLFPWLGLESHVARLGVFLVIIGVAVIVCRVLIGPNGSFGPQPSPGPNERKKERD